MNTTMQYLYLDAKGRCPYPDELSWKSHQGLSESHLRFLKEEMRSGAFVLALLRSEKEGGTILWDARLPPLTREILLSLPNSERLLSLWEEGKHHCFSL